MHSQPPCYTMHKRINLCTSINNCYCCNYIRRSTLHDGRTWFGLHKWYKRRINCDLFLCTVTHYSVCLTWVCAVVLATCTFHSNARHQSRCVVNAMPTSKAVYASVHFVPKKNMLEKETKLEKQRNETEKMQPVCGRNHMIKMLWCFFSVVFCYRLQVLQLFTQLTRPFSFCLVLK